MSELTTRNNGELVSVLQNSLYVGAKSESVQMVISYCAAAGLDVMQKPVHIVPMNTRNPVSGQYEWRDVVMPGIGLYRIQADRSGTLAGASEPEFGPDVTKTFRDKSGNPVDVTYPEWCKVTMKKMVSGQIVEFTAKEYWIENYATDSGKSDAPNAMWRKRPKGQIAKCAEAQALRKGWPEIGQAATAEEMEGKEIDMGPAQRAYEQEPAARVKQQISDDRLGKAIEKINAGEYTKAQLIEGFELTDEQISRINSEIIISGEVSND